MSTKSLSARNNELSNPQKQLEYLSEGLFADGELPTFKHKLEKEDDFPLQPKPLEILQINLGYMCNQVCSHCHVDAGPDRKEIMTVETMQHCLEAIKKTGELELEKGNVAFTNKGISVNEHLRNTSNKNVYACGDVSDSEGLPLTPLSSQESRVVSANLLGKYNKTEAHYPPQPSVVFTLPNVASIGLSEQQAKDRGFNYVVNHKSAPSWFNSKRIANRHYAFKVIKDKKTEQVLGAHLVGPEAGEMINMFVMAMCGGLSCKDLKAMIFAYPTWSNDIKGMT